ncbi:hypothetical protein KKG45_08220, partial [bacterium]|nr:hypothetical protein [bacterium]
YGSILKFGPKGGKASYYLKNPPEEGTPGTGFTYNSPGAHFRITGDLRGFVPLPWDHVLALRAWGRRTDGHVPPEDVLHWGGAETIRGHEYASREGEEGFLLSVEYRWPLFLMTISGDGRVIGIGLHAFGDAGSNWWDGDRRGTLYGYGGGAHINISDHQFRFELAFTGEGEAVFQFMDAFNF